MQPLLLIHRPKTSVDVSSIGSVKCKASNLYKSILHLRIALTNANHHKKDCHPKCDQKDDLQVWARQRKVHRFKHLFAYICILVDTYHHFCHNECPKQEYEDRKLHTKICHKLLD